MKKLERITIREGWYWIPGKIYGWDSSYIQYGVSINNKVLLENIEIEVEIVIKSKQEEKDRKRELYLLNCEDALAFAKRFESFETRHGTLLGVISKTLLKPVSVPEPEEGETEKKENSFRVGDSIKWVKNKFPELNTYKKAVVKNNGRFYEYEVKDRGVVGKTGVVIKIDDVPTTEYEINTGEVAKYLIEFKGGKDDGKQLHAFEDEIIKI